MSTCTSPDVWAQQHSGPANQRNCLSFRQPQCPGQVKVFLQALAKVQWVFKESVPDGPNTTENSCITEASDSLVSITNFSKSSLLCCLICWDSSFTVLRITSVTVFWTTQFNNALNLMISAVLTENIVKSGVDCITPQGCLG